MLASVLDRRLWKSFASLRGLLPLSRARTQRIVAVLLSLGLLLSPVGISSGHADVASGHGWTANDGHDRFEVEHGHDHDEDPGTGIVLGYSHGHDPADHSHNAACGTSGTVQLIAYGDPAWFGQSQSRLPSTNPSGIERPPRFTVAF
jgi:hypothetical protein